MALQETTPLFLHLGLRAQTVHSDSPYPVSGPAENFSVSILLWADLGSLEGALLGRRDVGGYWDGAATYRLPEDH